LRVVLDANTLIRAHGRRSTQARTLLEELLRAGHDLITSNELLAEVTKVLRYPKFQGLYGLTEADILCTHDGDFYDPTILSYCAARGHRSVR